MIVRGKTTIIIIVEVLLILISSMLVVENLSNISYNKSKVSEKSLANTPWPMFHHDLNHTGLSPYDTSSNDGTLKWKFQTGDYVRSSPAIGSDGTIYVGSEDGYLYAIGTSSIPEFASPLLSLLIIIPLIAVVWRYSKN